ncbi:MAG: ATP-binding cassette domain-containing protein, partial [Calditrichaeota bacterium]
MIQIEKLFFDYREPGGRTRRVLNGLTLEIREGETVALMGPNGSGKTTLARCLTGLLQPTAGEVVVDGLSTSEPENLPEIHRRVGLVF